MCLRNDAYAVPLRSLDPVGVYTRHAASESQINLVNARYVSEFSLVVLQAEET